MYNPFTLAAVGLLATLPLTLANPAGKPPKDCGCYTTTTTVQPEACILCAPDLECLVRPAITTTIPAPNPTCTGIEHPTVTAQCACGMTACPTDWVTSIGAFTCKRGGTKETAIAGLKPGETPDMTLNDAGTTGSMTIQPVTTETAAPAEPSDTGIMSILPVTDV